LLAADALSAAPDLTPRITVDAAKTADPMAPEIYSQFIEHLGRCIYGGIWAEMLEDRKFHFPVTADYRPYRKLEDTPYPVVGASPWQIIGAADRVSMNPDKPFVGKHTPILQAGAGIRQLDLGLTEGKEYPGYIWLKSAGPGTATVEVVLSWGEGENARQKIQIEGIGNEYAKHDFRFKAGATTDKAAFETRVSGAPVAVGTASLMPADNIEGLRADTLALLKELKAPIYRWPGGNFVSGYDWRDGIGDRDRRPPRTNPAWTGVEHNDFGMHEFIRFCRILDTEPWITVNTGFGDAHSAADQLQYCNGPADSLWGGRRASNGAPESFAVRYWGIGNEMWGDWQLGHMQLEHYVLKQNWVVDKMREVDPDIICIASGDIGNKWSEGMLKGCSDHMHFIAEHFYTQEKPDLAEHVREVPKRIRDKAEWHRKARAEIPQLKGRNIRIAMTEWNYWYGPHVFGELGTRYFMKDALGIAAGLHEFARQSDIIGSAFYAQTVNVIGAIKTSRRNAALETTGLVLKLYRHHFGEIPAATSTSGALDAQAMWTTDRKKLTLAVVNPALTPVEVPLAISGAKLKGTGTRWEIASNDPKAFNDPDTAPTNIAIKESAFTGPLDTLSLPPCSVTLIVLDAE
jgi:alpha-L-arabinofuranosidase